MPDSILRLLLLDDILENKVILHEDSSPGSRTCSVATANMLEQRMPWEALKALRTSKRESFVHVKWSCEPSSWLLKVP